MPYIYFFKKKESISLLNIFIGHFFSAHPAQGLFIRKKFLKWNHNLCPGKAKNPIREVSHKLM